MKKENLEYMIVDLQSNNPHMDQVLSILQAELDRPDPKPVAWVDERQLDGINDFDVRATLYARGGFDFALPLYKDAP